MLVALVMVGFAIERSFGQLGAAVASPSFLVTIAGGGAIYALLGVLLAFAWIELLHGVDAPRAGTTGLLAIYARTQVFKYLPSNVLHMVGRYVQARSSGVSHLALGVAQVAELVLLAASGALVAATLALPLLIDQAERNGLGAWVLPVIGGGALALAIATPLALRHFSAGSAPPRRLALKGALAVVLYVAFMLGSGSIAWALAVSLGDVGTDAGRIIGVTAAAWLVGFLVPGAPGGLGVRDAVLIAGLAAAGAPDATAIALGHRLVTVLGDAAFALAGVALARRR
jgi:uncharacterized membrane protein YbhN (UPF0104 family)